MMKTPQLLRYHNDEHIQFNRDIKRVCEDSNPDTLNVRTKFDSFASGIELMETAYLQTRGSELTKKIIAEDEVRDNLITGIEKGAEFYTYHFNPDYVEAGNRLLIHIHKYGDTIARLSYQAETTALNDFIDHYKNDNKLNAAVTLLGMNEWFVKLEESNIAFNDLYIMRVKENAGKPDLNLKELRKESAIQYRKLVKHLEAGNIINPSDLYNKVLKEINQLIDKYNSIRRKHKSGDDEPEE